MYWYEDDVAKVEQERQSLAYDPEIVFYGSSSIRLWQKLYEDFADLKPVNLGFGGSTLAACVWFFERIMQPYRPKMVVIYAGDNDLGDGRHPEEVFIFFQQLLAKIAEKFGNLPCYYISIKPSVTRWHMVEQFRYSNDLIKNEIQQHHQNWKFIDVFDRMLSSNGEPSKEYYVDDGLHLSEKGYQLWKEIVREVIPARL